MGFANGEIREGIVLESLNQVWVRFPVVLPQGISIRE